ncbi:MAG: hypothetical protein Crog4KO_16340 [Crocinitomicaceae bacterium]
MRTFIILAALLFPMIGWAQDCEKFRTGTFVFDDESGQRMVGYSIKRGKRYQTEYFEGGKSKWKVNWTSDCTYTLTLVKSQDINDLIGYTVTTRIIRTDEDSYFCVVTSEYTPDKMRFTIHKVK